MTETPRFEYNRLPYRGAPFAQTHPRWLATLASLYGMAAAPAAACSVLELGCGFGANLLPMAFQHPGSRFVGLDLSAVAIEGARQDAAALGLGNISYHEANILEADATALGRFDYIVAHGVYSWVPEAVRAKLLDLIGSCLAPHGLAYLSYNCRPGSHLRAISRDLMRFHVRDVDDPAERMAKARAVMRFAAEASPSDTLYGAVLREQSQRVADLPDEVLFHDDLEDSMTPFLLLDVVRDAAARGLAYLADASPAHAQPPSDGAVAKALERIPADQPILREQYLDLFVGRAFRQSVFCRSGVQLDRTLGAAALRRLAVAFAVTRAGDAADTPDGAATFEVSGGGRMSTDHPLSIAALERLAAAYPEAVRFDLLVAEAADRVPGGPGAVQDDDVDRVAGLLHQMLSLGRLEASIDPPPLAIQPGDRPEASLLARRQAASGGFVTNLTHGLVDLGDETMRRLIMLLDGTRSVDDLVAALDGMVIEREAGVPIAVSREDVLHGLHALGRLALLVR